MSSYKGTLYVGVTNNLNRRTSEHIIKSNFESFSSKYNCSKLVYFEVFNDIRLAIGREKQIKKYSRRKKDLLIKGLNPQFENLSIQDFSTSSNSVFRRSK